MERTTIWWIVGSVGLALFLVATALFLRWQSPVEVSSNMLQEQTASLGGTVRGFLLEQDGNLTPIAEQTEHAIHNQAVLVHNDYFCKGVCSAVFALDVSKEQALSKGTNLDVYAERPDGSRTSIDVQYELGRDVPYFVESRSPDLSSCFFNKTLQDTVCPDSIVTNITRYRPQYGFSSLAPGRNYIRVYASGITQKVDWHVEIENVTTEYEGKEYIIDFDTHKTREGTGWATWAGDLEDWDQRVNLTVNASQVNGSHDEFPIVIDLSILPDIFWGNVSSDGSDLVVTDDGVNATTGVPRELVFINTTDKEGELYAKINITSSTIIWVYFNNSAATETNSNETWRGEYEVVYHFFDQNDSTANDRDFSHNGSLVSTGGVLGYHTLNLTEAERAVIDGWAGVDGTTPRSSLAWTRTTDPSKQPISVWGTNTPGDIWRWVVHNVGGVNRLEVNSGNRFGATNVSDGVLHWLSANWNGTNVNDVVIYVDGFDDSDSGASQALTTNDNNDVVIGTNDLQSNWFNGDIDEFRIINISLGPAWMETEYNMFNTNNQFWSVGDVQNQGDAPPTPSDSCTYSSGNHVYQCPDHCNITTSVDHLGNNISLNGSGTFNIESGGAITNYDVLAKGDNCAFNLFDGGQLA